MKPLRPRARGIVAAVSLLIALGAPGCGERSSERPVRIVLFSMDTVRADRVLRGGDAETTPTLREIADEGVVFERAYAASNYTIPSHMSMFTGLDPAEHGVSRMFARLDPEVPTLAALLRAGGYRTQAFNEGVFVASRFGFDQGFDDYQTLSQSLVSDTSLLKVTRWMQRSQDVPYFLFLHTYAAHFPYGGYDRYRSENPERQLPSREELTRRSQRNATGTATGTGAEPGDGDESWDREQLHYQCTLHNQLAPYRSQLLDCGDNRPGPEFQRQPHFESDRAAIIRGYDDEIRRIDRALMAVRNTLVKLGQWDDTLFVVTSDHGDAFFEHGLYRHAFVPFDEVLRVPLVISYPRLLRAEAPRVETGLVSHLDLLPTILGFVGLPVPDGLAGSDLARVLRGEPLPEERAIFAGVLRAAQLEQVPLRRVVVRGHRKLIEGHEAFGDSEGFLYDLAEDPGELVNLRDPERDSYDELIEVARRYEAGLVSPSPVDQRSGEPLPLAAEGGHAVEALDPEAQSQLRALGYGD